MDETEVVEAWYGSFCGGDPRCFEPDPDGLMREELTAWVEACEAADEGAVEHEGAHQWLFGNGVSMHVTRVMFGLGVNHSTPLVNWRQVAINLQIALEEAAK